MKKEKIDHKADVHKWATTAMEIQMMYAQQAVLNAQMRSNPPLHAMMMPIQTGGPYTGTSAGRVAAEPERRVDIVIDGNSKALSDISYLRKANRLMKAHCEIMDLRELQELNNFDLSSMTKPEPSMIYGMPTKEMTALSIRINDSFVSNVPHGNPAERAPMLKTVSGCSGYLLHGLLSKGILPCMWNEDVAGLLVNDITINRSPRGFESFDIHIHALAMRFIESTMPVPMDENGRYNLQAANEMIMSVEYK